MKGSEILQMRLNNSGLSHSPFKSADDAVSHLGAVQAQDFAAAKWAVGLRMQDATEEALEKAFSDGAQSLTCGQFSGLMRDLKPLVELWKAARVTPAPARV